MKPTRKANRKWWGCFTEILFIGSSFIPYLHEYPDSPAISPAYLVCFAHAGPCNSAGALFALIKFVGVSFPVCLLLGWFLQAFLSRIFEQEKPAA